MYFIVKNKLYVFGIALLLLLLNGMSSAEDYKNFPFPITLDSSKEEALSYQDMEIAKGDIYLKVKVQELGESFENYLSKEHAETPDQYVARIMQAFTTDDEAAYKAIPNIGAKLQKAWGLYKQFGFPPEGARLLQRYQIGDVYFYDIAGNNSPHLPMIIEEISKNEFAYSDELNIGQITGIAGVIRGLMHFSDRLKPVDIHEEDYQYKLKFNDIHDAPADGIDEDGFTLYFNGEKPPWGEDIIKLAFNEEKTGTNYQFNEAFPAKSHPLDEVITFYRGTWKALANVENSFSTKRDEPTVELQAFLNNFSEGSQRRILFNLRPERDSSFTVKDHLKVFKSQEIAHRKILFIIEADPAYIILHTKSAIIAPERIQPDLIVRRDGAYRIYNYYSEEWLDIFFEWAPVQKKLYEIISK